MNQPTYQTSSNTNLLADFDFAFNGTLCPDEVRQIASAAFINKGENLLLVGDVATGKTMIAGAAIASARESGKSVMWLTMPTPMSMPDDLLDYGLGFIGSRNSRPGYREELLQCDALAVDEAERWLHFGGLLFLGLLAKRSQLGKSTVLVATTAGLQSALNLQVSQPSQFSIVAEADPAMRAMTMVPWRSVGEMLAALGLPVDHKHLLGKNFTAAPAANGLTAKIWHTLYTGKRSYRNRLTAL